MKIFAPVLERNRFLILTLKNKNADYFYLERNLRTKKVFYYFIFYREWENFPNGSLMSNSPLGKYDFIIHWNNYLIEAANLLDLVDTRLWLSFWKMFGSNSWINRMKKSLDLEENNLSPTSNKNKLVLKTLIPAYTIDSSLLLIDFRLLWRNTNILPFTFSDSEMDLNKKHLITLICTYICWNYIT